MVLLEDSSARQRNETALCKAFCYTTADLLIGWLTCRRSWRTSNYQLRRSPGPLCATFWSVEKYTRNARHVADNPEPYSDKHDEPFVH